MDSMSQKQPKEFLELARDVIGAPEEVAGSFPFRKGLPPLTGGGLQPNDDRNQDDDDDDEDEDMDSLMWDAQRALLAHNTHKALEILLHCTTKFNSPAAALSLGNLISRFSPQQSPLSSSFIATKRAEPRDPVKMNVAGACYVVGIWADLERFRSAAKGKGKAVQTPLEEPEANGVKQNLLIPGDFESEAEEGVTDILKSANELLNTLLALYRHEFISSTDAPVPLPSTTFPPKDWRYKTVWELGGLVAKEVMTKISPSKEQLPSSDWSMDHPGLRKSCGMIASYILALTTDENNSRTQLHHFQILLSLSPSGVKESDVLISSAQKREKLILNKISASPPTSEDDDLQTPFSFPSKLSPLTPSGLPTPLPSPGLSQLKVLGMSAFPFPTTSLAPPITTPSPPLATGPSSSTGPKYAFPSSTSQASLASAATTTTNAFAKDSTRNYPLRQRISSTTSFTSLAPSHMSRFSTLSSKLADSVPKLADVHERRETVEGRIASPTASQSWLKKMFVSSNSGNAESRLRTISGAGSRSTVLGRVRSEWMPAARTTTTSTHQRSRIPSSFMTSPPEEEPAPKFPTSTQAATTRTALSVKPPAAQTSLGPSVKPRIQTLVNEEDSPVPSGASTPLYKFGDPTLDPQLRTLEMSSKLTHLVQCSICGKEGVNFPVCGRCKGVFCGRECRVSVGKGGDGKRHVCKDGKIGVPLNPIPNAPAVSESFSGSVVAAPSISPVTAPVFLSNRAPGSGITA